ncbi:MAG: GTPase HflX [Hyphomicrobiales bacterium]|nr:GTPase HflX [Hyphomicrobiales bacterium]
MKPSGPDPGKGAGEGVPRARIRSPEARLEEAVGLAEAIDVKVVERGLVNLPHPHAGTLFGAGKVEEIKAVLHAEEIELVVVDGPVSPVQQRNLERAWGAKVIDRTGLILEIFGRRARTKEGRLQVELAHLSYQKTRLVRSWTHLERQRGGFGFLGGPGETQIEADRRVIQERITQIERQLEKVRRRRELQRKGRRRVPYAIVALVGYTNAGKSTLFNRLTDSEVAAEDQLFATLDPTLRAVALPSGRTVILSDTVGFISNLPTHLVAAFRATLEEVTAADLIVHVRDFSHPDTAAQAADVTAVLGQLGVDTAAERRIIEVWNKIDLLDGQTRVQLLGQAARKANVVAVSALTGEGLDALRLRIADCLGIGAGTYTVLLKPEEGGRLNWLYEHCDVRARTSETDGRVRLRVGVPRLERDLFLRRFAAEIEVKSGEEAVRAH